jgi:HlyD family type I secretion membrane fusion protein
LPTLVPLAAVPLEKVSVAAAQEVSHRDAELTLSSGDLRRSTRHTVWVGLLLVLLGIGGFGAWATLAPLTSAVVAPGVVKLSGGRKVVQHLEGGIIREIAVKDGQRVQAHDVVLRLDDTQARANLQLLQGRYNSLVARASRLTAERDGHQEITFPATLREQSADPETARLMSGQQELFQTRRNALASQTRVLRDRLRQFETQIEGLEAQRKAAQEQLGFIKEEMDAARGLYEKGIYEKPKYLALQRAAADLRGRVGQHTSSIAQTRERIGETEAQILNLQTQQTNEVVKEHEEVRTALFDTEERLRAARDVLERTVVRSPEGGVVVGLKFHTVGGVIPAGASIMDIVAADDSPIIEVQVRPADIDAVKVGLDTDVRFTAFNTRTTPSVQGKVVLVSADRLVDPSGMPYYEVRVEVGPDQVALLPSAGLYPGMPAEVHIVTGQRTVLDYAARPLIDGLKRATASSL